MGRKRNYGRSLSGVLVLNKDPGMSSNDALQKAKQLFFANKAGHTGSLDPLATGVLPICFGEATKFSQYLLDADKKYRSTFTLGASTTTADSEGDATFEADASSITLAAIEEEAANYCGDIWQIPPMVSALKYQGQPLYKLARRGIEIEREARPVTVYDYRILAFRPGARSELDVEIHCSKGTYIRSLADDLGKALGVGAHVSRLHRVLAGGLSDAQMVSLAELTALRGELPAEVLDHHLLPVDALLDTLPRLELSAHSGYYFRQGQAVMDLNVYRLGQQGDTVRVCQEGGQFLGIGEITDDGRVAPRRVVVGS